MNRQGELIAMQDQNLTQHAYARDLLGRVTLDAATPTPGSDIDDAVRAIGTTYDDADRVGLVTSYNTPNPNPNPAPAEIVNEVGFVYNGLWQILTVDQDHDGPIELSGGSPTGNTRRVQHLYEDADAASGGNFSRPRSCGYCRFHRVTFAQKLRRSSTGVRWVKKGSTQM